MKNTLIVFAFILSACASVPTRIQAKSVTFNIPDEEVKIVENDVLDAEEWLRNAWQGKLNKCKERLIKAEVDRSIKDGESIPAGESEIIDKAFKRPDYKSRKQRDALENK